MIRCLQKSRFRCTYSCRPCFFSKHEFTSSTTMVSLLRPQFLRCETALVWPFEQHGQVNLLSDFIGLSFKARNFWEDVLCIWCGENAQCFKGYTDGSEKTNGKLYFPQKNVKCLDFFLEWFRNPLSKIVGDIQLDQKLLLGGGNILCFDVRGKESWRERNRRKSGHTVDGRNPANHLGCIKLCR